MKYFSPSLLDGSVTTAKLVDGSVTAVKLADGAVQTAKLDNAAVTLEKIGNAQVNRDKFRSNTTSLAGSISGNSSVDLLLTRDCFWPMIHASDQTKVRVTGHTVDGVSADQPRLGLDNNAAGAETFDVDFRFLVL